jgi:hypothetical protein
MLNCPQYYCRFGLWKQEFRKLDLCPYADEGDTCSVESVRESKPQHHMDCTASPELRLQKLGIGLK